MKSRIRLCFLTGIVLLGMAVGIFGQIEWTRRYPLEFNGRWNGVAWTGTQAVAIGETGAISTSPDGIIWTRRNSGVSSTLNFVAASKNKILVVGDSGLLLTSEDGITWNKRLIINNNYTAIACSDSQAVIVGLNGAIYSSKNGNEWVQCISGTDADLHGICLADKKWVAGGTKGIILTSDDGINWTKESAGLSGSNYVMNVVWTGTKIVATVDAQYVVCSNNGADWSSKIPVSKTLSIKTILWTGKTLVTIGKYIDLVIDGVLQYGCASSPDGITWTDIPTAIINAGMGATWAGDRIVAVGKLGSIWTTNEDLDWTEQIYRHGGYITGIVWTGTQWLASYTKYRHVNGYGYLNAILSSVDGINWEIEDSGSVSFGYAIWFNNNVVATDLSNGILTSADGTAWTKRDSTLSVYLHDIEKSGSMVIAVGDSGTIKTSVDGNIWTQEVSDVKINLYSALWIGDQWLVGGDSATILLSADGKNWNKLDVVIDSLPPTDKVYAGTFKEIALIGDELIANMIYNSYHSEILSSLDGKYWKKEYVQQGTCLTQMSCMGDKLYALRDGFVITSADSGKSWIQGKSDIPQSAGLWGGIARNDSIIVSVGTGGTIVTSPIDHSGDVSVQKVTDNVVPKNIGELSLNVIANTLQVRLPLKMWDAPVSVSLYSINGKKLKTASMVSAPENLTMNVRSLPAGIYVASVKCQGKKVSKMFPVLR